MSFGASPSDIIIVVTFCRTLYRKCKSAGGEYDEISREVRGLHSVLKHLKHEVETPESPLNQDHSLWGRQLAPIIGDCDFTLRQLDDLLQKYGRLGGGGSSPSSPRNLWERLKFGSSEMDTLGEIRVKMISHKTTLTLFLDTIQLRQSGKMSEKLDSHQGQLDVILDKVDNIAARVGQGEGSIMTSYDNDDKEVWKQFRRELIAEGFSSDVLQQHKDVLRAYIREIDQNGLLDEPSISTPPLLASKQWVDSIQATPFKIPEDVPPSFSSLGTATDGGIKEMVIQEDNMKFPQSMKLELREPDSRQNGREVSQPKAGGMVNKLTGNTSEAPSPAILIPSQLVPSNEKEVVFHNADNSSSDEEHYGGSSKGAIIRTTDLLALTRALQLHVPGPSSATSFRSSLGSIDDNDVLRSMAFRPKKQAQLGASPSQADPIGTPARPSRDNIGASPFLDVVHKLAPDQHGNEITPDAMWTKINRALVSPEVLRQDGRRYEARPEFVAVLGILSRVEVKALAARSQTLRAARHRRSIPVDFQPDKEVTPALPPRPKGVDQSSSSFGSSSQQSAGLGQNTRSDYKPPPSRDHGDQEVSNSPGVSSLSSRPAAVQHPSFSFNSASPAHGRRSSPALSYSSSSDSEYDSDYERQRQRWSQQQARDSINENQRPPPLAPIAVKERTSSGHRGSPILVARASESTARQAMYMSGGLGVPQQTMGQSQSWSPDYHPPSRNQHSSDVFRNSQARSGSWAPPLTPRPTQQSPRQYPVRNEEDTKRDRSERERKQDRERQENERGERGHRRRRPSNHGGHRDSTHHDCHSHHDQITRQEKQSRWKENLASAGIGGAAASLIHVLTEAAEAL